MKKTKKAATKRRSTKKVTKPLWKRTLWQGRYVPALVISLFALILAWQPYVNKLQTNGVLSYATNTSPTGLLNATNTQRVNNGVGTLSSNGLLASAAQAKANDMVNKDYWSHISPDGTQPWTFIQNAGYAYTSAGENLAYGFLSSGDTVTGWMNSPSHKSNLLSTAFSEVGFGIANSENFVGQGQQTVVVAMYASPRAASVATTAPTPTPTATTTPKSTAPAPTAESTPIEELQPEPTQEETIAITESEETPVVTATQTNIPRVSLLSSNRTYLSAAVVIIIVLLVALAWALHHGKQLHRYIRKGERYITHHPYVDLTLLAVLFLGFVLLSTTGAVR